MGATHQRKVSQTRFSAIAPYLDLGLAVDLGCPENRLLQSIRILLQLDHLLDISDFPDLTPQTWFWKDVYILSDCLISGNLIQLLWNFAWRFCKVVRTSLFCPSLQDSENWYLITKLTAELELKKKKESCIGYNFFDWINLCYWTWVFRRYLNLPESYQKSHKNISHSNADWLLEKLKIEDIIDVDGTWTLLDNFAWPTVVVPNNWIFWWLTGNYL